VKFKLKLRLNRNFMCYNISNIKTILGGRMEKIDFLKPTINSIRKSIRGIDDSYNNFWDIIAELVQNSVDAINKTENKSGRIDIEINCQKKQIIVRDTGIGIDSEKLPNLLSPFSTDKENDYDTIGEKGVGLKFVIFQSNEFNLKTCYLNENKTSYVNIQGAKSWKESDLAETFYLNREVKNEKFIGTEIIVKGIDNDELFNLNFNELEFILRTRTAIGNILSVFGIDNDVEVNLNLFDINGRSTSKKIPYKYWLPIENVKKNDKYDLDDFKTWLSETDRTDAEKRNKLKNKIIFKQGTIMHQGYREIKYWSCFVPKRKIWNDISIQDGLLTDEMIDDEELMQQKFFSTHQAGIFTSVKGMPTGIIIDHPNTGYAGYWANIFIIFEDKNLKFDIGRKSINGSTKTIYKEHSKEIFTEYLKYITKYLTGEPEIESNPVWDRDDIKAEIDNMPRLNTNMVKFKNNPAEQEASVAAIFYELIGADKIPELLPVISGYRNKYDLYAYWQSHFVIIEFKSHLRNIVRDFDDYVKYSNEIDYIVCWDVNDTDLTALHDVGLLLEPIEESTIFEQRRNCIPISTHRLIISSTAKPIYIIDLKIVLKKLSERND